MDSCCFLLLYASLCFAKIPYNDVKSDYESLLSAYKAGSVSQANIIPRDPTTGPINVYVGFHLDAIVDYDGVNGRIHLVGNMQIEWLDEIKGLTGTTFKGSLQTIVFVRHDQIWSPVLVFVNEADSSERIGDTSYYIRYNTSSGLCTWNPRIVPNVACTPNMKYFPFDQQTCTLTVSPKIYSKNELTLTVLNNKWDLTNFEPSVVWKVYQTSSDVYINTNTSQFNIDFTITIHREPLFLVLFIVLPVLLLSVLSAFVFFIPPNSGCRATFGILNFLCFVSILRMLLDLIPEAASPLPLLCYYIITMMLFIGLTSVANIFILRIYLLHETNTPRFIVILINKLCKCFPPISCSCKNKVHASDEQTERSSVGNNSVRRLDTVFNVRFASLSRNNTSFHEIPKESNSSPSVFSECSINELKRSSAASDNEVFSENTSARTDSVFNLRFSTQLKSLSQLSEVEESKVSPFETNNMSPQGVRYTPKLKRGSLFRNSSFIEKSDDLYRDSANRHRGCGIARSKSCIEGVTEYDSSSDGELERLEHPCMIGEPGESPRRPNRGEIASQTLLSEKNENIIPREHVGHILDRLFFILFCFIQLIFSVSIVTPTVG